MPLSNLDALRAAQARIRAALIANHQCPDCGGPLPKGWLTCGKCDEPITEE